MFNMLSRKISLVNKINRGGAGAGKKNLPVEKHYFLFFLNERT